MPGKLSLDDAKALVAKRQEEDERARLDTVNWSEYKNATTKLTFTCATHGEYQTTIVRYATSGKRCAKCWHERRTQAVRFTVEDYLAKIQEFAEKDPERYEFMDFSNSKLTYARTASGKNAPRLSYVCHFVDPKTGQEHGEQCSLAHDMITDAPHDGKPRTPSTCSKCRARWSGIKQSSSWEYCMDRARANPCFDTTDFSLAKPVYKYGQTLVPLICTIHGKYEITMHRYMRGNGCLECAKSRMGPERRSVESYNEEIHAKLGDHLTLLERDFNGDSLYGLFYCTTHERRFVQNISSAVHHRRIGCRECQPLLYDNTKCKKWLEAIEQQENIVIRRADAPCEFVLPGTGYRVDGYHAPTNRVFEFYEESEHGHQHPDDARYRRTVAREEEIRRRGYEVVVLWERDYDATMHALGVDLSSSSSSSDTTLEDRKRPRSVVDEPIPEARPRSHSTRPLTNEQFVESCRNRRTDHHERYSLVGEYSGVRNHITLSCPVHGQFTMSPHNYKDNDQDCPACAKITAPKSRRGMTVSEVREMLIQIQQSNASLQHFDFLESEVIMPAVLSGVKKQAYLTFRCHRTADCIAAGVQQKPFKLFNGPVVICSCDICYKTVNN